MRFRLPGPRDPPPAERPRPRSPFHARADQWAARRRRAPPAQPAAAACARARPARRNGRPEAAGPRVAARSRPAPAGRRRRWLCEWSGRARALAPARCDSFRAPFPTLRVARGRLAVFARCQEQPIDRGGVRGPRVDIRHACAYLTDEMAIARLPADPSSWRQLPEWNDWRWQMRHRIARPTEIDALLPNLTDAERAGLAAVGQLFRVGITPYYFALVDRENAACPIRQQVIPLGNELHRAPGEYEDPLGEDARSPAPGLVHKYPDRVLLLATT